MDDYLDALRVRHYAPATVQSRANSLQAFGDYLGTIGVTDLREVSREAIADFQRRALREHSVGTVRILMACLRHFFAHLENTDAILLNPTLGIPLPKTERRLPKRLLQPSEVRKLLNAPDTTPKGLRDRAILELFYSSGIRREEMTRLTLPDLDLKNGFVRITRGKGSRDRVVPIGQTACEALARYLKNARNVWLKAPRNPGWTNALWLSPIQPHAPIHNQAMSLIVLRYARRFLGRNVSPHLWRHTCATQLLSNGANVVYVQRLLGHKSLKTTEIYTRVSMAELRKTMQRTHPRTRRAATPPAVLTREDAAQMPGGHRHQHERNPHANTTE
jgi:site-specific recombinase XerD